MFLVKKFIPRIVYFSNSEAMAARNAVLSQSPEFKDVRTRAFTNATVVYDLLTVALVRWKQYTLLQEVRKNYFSIMAFCGTNLPR